MWLHTNRVFQRALSRRHLKHRLQQWTSMNFKLGGNIFNCASNTLHLTNEANDTHHPGKAVCAIIEIEMNQELALKT